MVAAAAAAVRFPPHCLRCETDCLTECRLVLLLLLPPGWGCLLVELKVASMLLLVVVVPQQLPRFLGQRRRVCC
jgi:hypothetical protein